MSNLLILITILLLLFLGLLFFGGLADRSPVGGGLFGIIFGLVGLPLTILPIVLILALRLASRMLLNSYQKRNADLVNSSQQALDVQNLGTTIDKNENQTQLSGFQQKDVPKTADGLNQQNSHISTFQGLWKTTTKYINLTTVETTIAVLLIGVLVFPFFRNFLISMFFSSPLLLIIFAILVALFVVFAIAHILFN
ncbi:MAG: hypothetical protein AAF708_09780 [Deinococcota bacterium]